MSSTIGVGRVCPLIRVKRGTTFPGSVHRKSTSSSRVRLIGHDRADVPGVNGPNRHGDALAALRVAEADLLDDQRHFGSRGDQLLEPRIGLPRQRQEPTVHQIAGARLQVGNLLHGPDGRLEVAEQKQHGRSVRRKGKGLERRRGKQAQRPFRSDEQAGHVQVRGGQQAPHVIAGAVADEGRLLLPDDLAVFRQQSGQASDDRPLGDPAAARCRSPGPRRSSRRSGARGELPYSASGSSPNSTTVPPASTVSMLATWSRVEPTWTECEPAASTPSIPPTVVMAVFDGSGGKYRPYGRRIRLS